MIFLDFETRSVIDIKKLGAHRYAHDPSTKVLVMRWAYDDEEKIHIWHRAHNWIAKSAPPRELIERIRKGEIVEAHNAMFEFLIWNIALRREFPEFDVELQEEQMRCSAAKASCMSLPRGLGEAVDALGLPERKDESGKGLISRLSRPKPRRKNSTVIEFSDDETDHRANWEYCAQDVRAERGLSKALPEMSETELRYWRMDWRMNRRGILLDMKAVHAAMKLIASETKRLNAEISAITNGEVPAGSKRKLFRAWVNSQGKLLEDLGYPGIYLPDTKADTLSFALHGVPTKAGDEAKAAKKKEMDELWETKLGEAGRPIHRAIEICMEVNRTSNSKYKRMLASVCPDGRLHDIMLYNGADRTGRWSGKGVQPHNFVRGYMAEMDDVWDDIFETGDGVSIFTDDDPLPALAKAARGALISSPGKELYAADFNAIEARKLAWMANCIKQLELFRSKPIVDAAKIEMKAGRLTPEQFALIEAKYDPYLSMAAAIYQRDDLTKKNKTERGLGKRAVLGLGYAMGWEKFQATVYNEEGIELDDEFCKKVVHVYRTAQCPEVPKLWADVNDAAIDAVLHPGEKFIAGGNEIGDGSLIYFTEDRFLRCRLPSGRCLAYLDPEVKESITYWFFATNKYGKPCKVTVSNVGLNVPQHIVKNLAETYATREEQERAARDIWSNKLRTEGLRRIVERTARNVEEAKTKLALGKNLDSASITKLRSKIERTQNTLKRREEEFRSSSVAVDNDDAIKIAEKSRRVEWKAKSLAEKSGKKLSSASPEFMIKQSLTFMGRHIATRKWQRLFTHGGTLVENADQASSRDLLAEAMYRVDNDPRFDLLLSIHDEVIAEAPIDTCTVEEFEEIMAEAPIWARTMPITAEGWIGPRLRK